MLANIEHLSRFLSPSITMMMRTVKRMIKYLIFGSSHLLFQKQARLHTGFFILPHNLSLVDSSSILCLLLVDFRLFNRLSQVVIKFVRSSFWWRNLRRVFSPRFRVSIALIDQLISVKAFLELHTSLVCLIGV